MKKISILLILLLLLTVISLTACEEKDTKIITEEEKDTFVPVQEPVEKPPEPEQTYPETTNTVSEGLVEMELTKKSDEIWLGISLLADEINKEEILSFKGNLVYDKAIYDIEYEKLVDDMICDFDKVTGVISCASPFPIPDSKIINFRLKLKYTPNQKDTSEVVFKISKINAREINLETKQTYTFGCLVGSDCGDGVLCIAGLCGGNCETNIGIECQFTDSKGINQKGLCAHEDIREPICDTELLVKSEIGTTTRGYWDSCKAGEKLAKLNANLYDAKNNLFNEQACDPSTLDDGFNPVGICLNGECVVNLPDIQIKDIKIELDSHSYVVATVTLINNGIKDIRTSNEIKYLSFDICSDEKCKKPVLSLSKENEFILESKLSKQIKFETRHIFSDVEMYRVTADPNNEVEELDEENNVMWKE